MPTTCATTVGLTALLALPALAACADGTGAGRAAGAAVRITADDDRCVLERTELEAGPVTFTIRNEGSETTEVYVYGRAGDAFTEVVTEVENIGPGTSRQLDADLAPGEYEVACKPGQRGSGIRTPVVVSGRGGASHEETEEGYDREVELTSDGTSVTGLEGGATEGEALELELTNGAAGARTLEVKDPTGAVAGEVEDIQPGTTGELVVELDEPGTWQVVVEGDGAQDVAAPLTVR